MRMHIWQWRFAIAPIWHKPLHFFTYFLVLCALSVSLYAFFVFQSKIAEAQDRSLEALLGGDVMIDGGYRPFETSELQYFESISQNLTMQTEFRSMLEFNTEKTPIARLANVRAVDDVYPMSGQIDLESEIKGANFQELLALEDEHYGVLLSPELTAYFDVKYGGEITIADEVFIYRGKIALTPDLGGIGQDFLPTAMISRDALQGLEISNDEMLLQSIVFLDLPEGTNLQITKDEIINGYHDQGWQIRTRDEFSKNQSGYLTLAKRLSGFINILVLLSFGIALFVIFKTHINEERSSYEQLLAQGSSAGQIAFSFLIRLSILLLICLCAIFALSMGAAWLTATLQNHGGFSVHDYLLANRASMRSTALIVALFSYFTASLAYWLNLGRHQIAPLIIAVFTCVALLLYLLPHYALNPIMETIIVSFVGLIWAYWFFMRLLKPLIRRWVRPRSVRRFSLLEFAGKHSTQENFSALVFANVIIITCLIGMIFAVQENARSFREAPKPSHYLADIQPDQVQSLKLLLNDNGAQNLTIYPIIRARLVSVNNEPSFDRQEWIFRGDRIFGIDEKSKLGLQKIQGGRYEAAMDRRSAEELGLAKGDELGISVLGEEIPIVIRELYDTNPTFMNLEFLFTLPQIATQDLPHIFLASAYFEKEQSGVIRKIVDQFPNVILVSTEASVSRINTWIADLLRYLGTVGAHVLGSTIIALLSVGVLIMRRERYNQQILNMLGMKSRDRRRMQTTKIFFNAVMTTLISFFVIWAFNQFALKDLIELNVNIRWLPMVLIVFGFGLICAALPSIMLIFTRPKPQKLEAYAQDFTSQELDF